MRLGNLSPSTIDPLLKVGERVKFAYGDTRLWWTVKAADTRFAILTAAAPFKKKGVLMYTIVDYHNGVRGASNEIGQGLGDGTFSTECCEEALKELNANELEVSHRNRVPLGDLVKREEVK